MPVTARLIEHHQHCDELFAKAEDAWSDGNWPAVGSAVKMLVSELETHFCTEEEVLFPAFEDATGMRGGPTDMMRREHEQMRDLLGRLSQAHADRDADAFGGDAEALMILMRQHNLKEENILYPMCDNALTSPGLAADIVGRLG